MKRLARSLADRGVQVAIAMYLLGYVMGWLHGLGQ